MSLLSKQMNMRMCVAFAGCFVLGIALIGCRPAKEKPVMVKPNILWIVADDLGLELGCYNDSLVRTPNLDYLASLGMRYTNFFTTSPVCSPSRSSIITGKYPSEISSQAHRTMKMDSLPHSIKTLPELLKDAGYYTFNQDFNDNTKIGKTDYNFLTHFQYDGTTWSGRQKDQPFFGQLQILRPHRPFVRDEKNPIDYEKVVLPEIYPNIPVLQADWALYLESVQVMDNYVGLMLSKLKEAGLFENTIVFFFGDHGHPHLFGKQFLYDGGLKSPLIIYNPFEEKNGVSEALVSGIDLAVSTLKMTGTEVPEHLAGSDFYNDEHADVIYAQRDRSGDAVDRIRALRTTEYKYIQNLMPEKALAQKSSYKRGRYPAFVAMNELHKKGQLSQVQSKFFQDPRPKEELYYLPTDPNETINLADSKEHKKVLGEMRDLMTSYRAEYDTVIEDFLAAQEGIEASQRYGDDLLIKKGLSKDVTDAEILEYWEDELLKKD